LETHQTGSVTAAELHSMARSSKNSFRWNSIAKPPHPNLHETRRRTVPGLTLKSIPGRPPSESKIHAKVAHSY
jgi:hypothetical protein